MIKYFLFLLFPLFLSAQWVDDMNKAPVQPRTMLGGQASYFRISVHNFEDIYAGRWGESFGGFAGVRAFGAHYITLKYGTFSKGGKSGIHPPTGLRLENARWNEHWYKIGLRIHPPIENKWGSYYGFGLGFYQVQEQEPLSIFQTMREQGSNTESGGTGFYLELGVDYMIINNVAAFFELEISSGGTRGRSSFEAMSVGGWLLSLGLIVWPF